MKDTFPTSGVHDPAERLLSQDLLISTTAFQPSVDVLLRLGRVMCCRFEDYDGRLLSEFVQMHSRAPVTVYNALFKENFTTTDIAKLNLAIEHLPL